jgi:hypothetical protein
VSFAVVGMCAAAIVALLLAGGAIYVFYLGVAALLA